MKDKRRYTIIIEQADGNYSAYCPEMPGCVATGATENEAYQNMTDALKFHIEGLEMENQPLPDAAVTIREAVM